MCSQLTTQKIFFLASQFFVVGLSLCRLVDGCLGFVFGWNVACCFGFAGAVGLVVSECCFWLIGEVWESLNMRFQLLVRWR